MNTKKNDILSAVQRNMVFLILGVIMLVFTVLTDNFWSYRNFMNILMQNSYIVIAGLGVSLILMSGQMDISIGYQMALLGVSCAMMIVYGNLQWPVAVLITILLGVAFSVANCLLSIKLGIKRMYVSIGTMAVFQGLSYIVSNSTVIHPIPADFKFLGQGYILNVSFPVILMFVLLVITSFMLNKTYFGRYVYALGGNLEAARLAGINVTAVNIGISVICGIMVAVSAIVMTARIGSAHASTGPGTEFTVLTGSLLGGVSIRGGEGKLSGVFAGLIILGILSNGMQLAGMGIYYQYVAKGVIMLAAVGFDVYQMNSRNRARNLRKEYASIEKFDKNKGQGVDVDGPAE